MTKLTKAQLVAENEALRNELNTLRRVHAQEIASITSVATAVNRMRTPTPQWQVERKVAMDAAREAALTTRSCVKV